MKNHVLLLSIIGMSLLSQTAFAGTCEDGTGNPSLCVELLERLYAKAIVETEPTNRAVVKYPHVDTDIEMICYRESVSISALWNPESYDAKLKFRHYKVTADHSELKTMAAYLDTGRDRWHEDSAEAIKYEAAGGFVFFRYIYNADYGVHFSLKKYKEQYIGIHEVYEDDYRRKDICIQKI